MLPTPRRNPPPPASCPGPTDSQGQALKEGRQTRTAQVPPLPPSDSQPNRQGWRTQRRETLEHCGACEIQGQVAFACENITQLPSSTTPLLHGCCPSRYLPSIPCLPGAICSFPAHQGTWLICEGGPQEPILAKAESSFCSHPSPAPWGWAENKPPPQGNGRDTGGRGPLSWGLTAEPWAQPGCLSSLGS